MFDYSSVEDIAYLVRNFLEDIIIALDLKELQFNSEVTIKHIKPDMRVIFMQQYLVGAVKVKEPGSNVLLQPTVLGELLDQMLLVESFYGMGPVIGILTTGEEWIISWFPADTEQLKVEQLSTVLCQSAHVQTESMNVSSSCSSSSSVIEQVTLPKEAASLLSQRLRIRRRGYCPR